jgi:hypothetical protein
MVETMVLEFPAGVGKAHYETAIGKLGIDTTRRDSDRAALLNRGIS